MKNEGTPVEMTDEEKMDNVENVLITEGIMIPASDLVHYMTRNASYMRLINSEAFKESGIQLEEVLDDEFIEGQFKANAKTAEMMRFVTEKIVPMMQERLEGANEAMDAAQPDLVGLDVEGEVLDD